MTTEELVECIRLMCASYKSQKAAAEAWGISETYLCDILQGRREPGKMALDKIGVERVVTYRWKSGGQP